MDFIEIFDTADKMVIHDVASHRGHSVEANEVSLGNKVIMDFTITIWRKKPESIGCSFHLIDVRVLESAGDNISGRFNSSKKRQRIA
jgi:hypothetical protein